TAVTQQAPPPSAPTNLAAVAQGSMQISLTWTASTGGVGAITYEIDRCSGAGCPNFVKVGTTGAVAFTDTGLAASTAYTYEVRATASGVSSAFSSPAGASTSAGGGTIATPKFVQVNSATPQSPSTQNVSLVFSKAQTAGNLNVVVVGNNDTSSRVSSVTD